MFQIIDKRNVKGTKYGANFVIFLLCILLVVVVLLFFSKENCIILFLIFLILSFQFLFLFIWKSIRKNVNYIQFAKSTIHLHYKYLYRELQTEIEVNNLKVRLKSIRGTYNTLLGFELILISGKGKFILSDSIFELAEIQGIYQILVSKSNHYDETENFDSLKQIRFQTNIN